MAIIDIELLKASGAKDEHFERTWTREYLVTSNSILDNEQYITDNLNALGTVGGYTLSMLAVHPTDGNSFVKNISADLTSQWNEVVTRGALWNAKVEWGHLNPYEFSPDGNPLNQPIEWSIEGIDVDDVVDNDAVTGNAIVNTAYQRYNPTLSRFRSQCTIKITKNYVGLNQKTDIMDQANNVNIDTWFGYAPYTVRVAQPRITQLHAQQTASRYQRVEWTFDVDPDGWQAKVASMGFDQLAAGGVTWERILDSAGNQCADPHYLDAAGHALVPPVSNANIIVTTYNRYPTINFASTFGFPSTMFDTP
jgi:hypothetical protein